MNCSQRKFILAALSLALVTTTGCTSHPYRHAALKAELIVEGKIVSRANIDMMEGDVAVYWSRYVLETRQAPHESVEFLSELSCPAGSSPDQLYLVMLNRWTFSINGEKKIYYLASRCATLEE